MIADYLAQQVYLRTQSGQDGYGQPTYSVAGPLKGRWVEKMRLVLGRGGEQVASDASVTLEPSCGVRIGDALSLDEETWKRVLGVSRSLDINGNVVCVRAYLGSEAAP